MKYLHRFAKQLLFILLTLSFFITGCNPEDTGGVTSNETTVVDEAISVDDTAQEDAIVYAAFAAIAPEDAIVTAAFDGNLAAVEALIKAGADVNFKVNEGGTALMMASQRGHTEVVRALLKGGADVDATDDSGVTALMLASEKGDVDVVRLLQEGAKQ